MQRPAPQDEQRQRWTEGLIRELGDTIVAALGDDDVVEILLNPDGRIWLDSRSEGMVDSGARLLPQEGEAILASIAGMLGTQIDSEHPIIEAELPLDGSRIEEMQDVLIGDVTGDLQHELERLQRNDPLRGNVPLDTPRGKMRSVA